MSMRSRVVHRVVHPVRLGFGAVHGLAAVPLLAMSAPAKLYANASERQERREEPGQ